MRIFQLIKMTEHSKNAPREKNTAVKQVPNGPSAEPIEEKGAPATPEVSALAASGDKAPIAPKK